MQRPRAADALIPRPGPGTNDSRRTDRSPLGWKNSAEESEAAAAERPKDERLTLLERQPGRIRHHDSVRDENGEPAAPSWLRPEQPPCRSDLRPPSRVVLRGDGVQERGAHGCTTEREPCRSSCATERAREDSPDSQLQASYAAPDCASVGATLLREVALRVAVSEVDRVLVGLREVRRRVSEDEHQPAPLQVARQRWIAVWPAPAPTATAPAVTIAPESATCRRSLGARGVPVTSSMVVDDHALRYPSSREGRVASCSLEVGVDYPVRARGASGGLDPRAATLRPRTCTRALTQRVSNATPDSSRSNASASSTGQAGR